MKDFKELYKMDKYVGKFKKYYVEWAIGLNKKYFDTLKEACQFADTIKGKDVKIYMIHEIIF